MKVYYIGDCGHFVFLPNQCETCAKSKEAFSSGMVTVDASYLHTLESQLNRLREQFEVISTAHC
jgi:hypothetical protein